MIAMKRLLDFTGIYLCKGKKAVLATRCEMAYISVLALAEYAHNTRELLLFLPLSL
jgi:hypothetical protein